jgi:hemerythrin-like domain-containing protein
MKNLLDALWNEHRSIAAVLHAMTRVLHDADAQGRRPDPRLLRAMLYYLDVFPERVHHPKEEKYLFPAIRRRTHDADHVLEALERQHEEGEQAMRRVEQALLRYEQGGAAEYESLREAVTRFVTGYREHMRKEEQEIMPLAQRVLGDAEWAELNAEWAAHHDPLAGIESGDEYERLLDRIVELAPVPMGLGRS